MLNIEKRKRRQLTMIEIADIQSINEKLFLNENEELNKNNIILAFDDLILPKNYDKYFKKKNIDVYIIKKPEKKFHINNLVKPIRILINHINDKGVLIKNEEHYHYIYLKEDKSLKSIGFSFRWFKNPLKRIHRKFDRYKEDTNAIIQLSDLHFGEKANNVFKTNYELLKNVLLDVVNDYDQKQFIITGDIQNTPDDNIYQDYAKFEGFLSDISMNDVLIIPGNHDARRRGLGLNRINRKGLKFDSDYPIIKANDEQKIIFILFDSNKSTLKHFIGANGHIGKEQMKSATIKLKEYKENDKYKDYRYIALLHHHVNTHKMEGFKEGFIDKVMHSEFFLAMDDNEEFLKWMKDNQVLYAMHGHKHIPYVSKVNEINIFSCGSSLKSIKMDGISLPFITYNTLIFKKDVALLIQYYLKKDETVDAKIHLIK